MTNAPLLKILTIDIFIFLSLMCTVPISGGTQALLKADTTKGHSMALPLNSWINNSTLNNSSPLTSTPLSLAKIMRNSNETLPVPGDSPYIAPNKNYVFSQNKSEISGPNNNSHTREFGKGVKIAVVMPTFTAAAYDNAFYVFYRKYINVVHGVNITTDLNLFTSKVTNEPSSSASGFAMLSLLDNLKWITPESSISILTDQDVDKGSIFLLNGSNNFNVMILGHQEYVTQDEYDNLKRFVANGGTMIILDGNVFYAEVKYDRNTDDITLVKGHSWAFNDESAWRSVNERWKNETAQWVGSNYISGLSGFARNPFDYFPHEEQYVTNPNDIILLNYNATSRANTFNKTTGLVVATYELNYLRGKVIAIGLYSDDIITNGSFDRYLDNLILHYALRSPV
jgi:hypothetical protein